MGLTLGGIKKLLNTRLLTQIQYSATEDSITAV